MKLADGWDSELQVIAEAEQNAREENERLGKEMHQKTAPLEQRIRRIERAYQKKMHDTSGLYQQREEEWTRIREQYPIEHPRQKKKMKFHSEAAAVLAHYWIGEEIPENKLINLIMSDPQFNVRAFEYATHLTEPDSPERVYIRKAQDFLWKYAGR